VSRRWGSKNLTYLSGAFLLAWTATLIVLIAHQPPVGADSPDGLAKAFSAAVAGNDRPAVERLINEDVEPQVIDQLIQQSKCGNVIRATSTHLDILTAGDTRCGQLPIAEHRGRWFIDPWADPLRRI
jgi:hypothetical protein